MAWTNSISAGSTITTNLWQEMREAVAMYDGIGISNSAGVTISFSSPFSSVDDYWVHAVWQEYDSGNGDLKCTKELNSVLIENTGSIWGKKFHYRIGRVKNL